MQDNRETALILDGKSLAGVIRQDLAVRVSALETPPGLAVILVGDDPASAVYVRNKIRACEQTGVRSFEHRLPAHTPQAEISALIQELNTDPQIHGILLQLPLPAPLEEAALIDLIAPHKDVDGLTTHNAGRLVLGLSGIVPCTPQGALALIHSVRKDLSGLHALVIGRSRLFGKPMAALLLAQDCTVTQAHSRTRDLPALCAQADILICAIGRPRFVQGAWIKAGAIVIDVGINRLPDGRLVGDVDFESALPRAAAITPVPGGVGPMTIACLLQNTVRAREAF